MDEFQMKLRPNPEKNANFFSRMFFCFISPLLRLGYKRPLETSDLYEALPADESSMLCDQLEKAWHAEIASSKEKNRKPQLKRAVVAVFGRKFGMAGIITILEELIKLAQAVFMGGLIRYFRFQSTVTTEEAYGYAIGLTLCAIALAVVHHPYFYYLQRIGMRIRISCSALLYKKSLTLSSSSLKKVTVGKIVNMLSNDVSRFDQAVLFLHYVWAAPLSLIGFAILLWFVMGPSCLAGFLCLLLLVPLQGVIGRQMGKYRREVASCADKRIGIMSEILNGIRVIKMYAWEQPFSQLVDKARMSEIKKLRVQAVFQGLIMGLFFVSGKLIVLFAIVAYVLSGQAINAEVIFVASALFNSARLTVTLFLPFAIQFLAETKVTFGRMEDFLLLEDKHLPSLPAPSAFSGDAVGTDDHLPYIDEKIDDEAKRSMRNLSMTGVKGNKPPPLAIQSGENAFVEMIDYCAKWDEDGPLTLFKINLSVKPGQLTIIVGPVGAGKSSILLSLLGETKQVDVGLDGQIRMQGSVAYVPQEAWIFSATLRRNVTFGVENLDMIRYQQALTVCALKKDVEVMPNGDMTIIGDKGVGLSGGQKARVNLARAVYSDADIYLLDDPLSAVDSTVGRYLFEKCILGHLRDKPRILVTHQLQYLPSADNILVVKAGKIVASGTFKELQNLGDEFTAILQECEDSYKRRESVTASSPTSTIPQHRKGSQANPKMSSRQNSVQQPPSPTLVSPTTSSPKAGVDSLPKLDFRSPGREDSGENHSGTDFESYRKAISRGAMNVEAMKQTAETEKLLKNMPELEQLKEVDEEETSFTESMWSLEGAEATLPQQDEDRSTGAVNWRVYYEYFSAMANFCVVMLLLLFCFFVQALFNFSDWWLNIWTTQAEYEDRLKRSMITNTSGPVDASITPISVTRAPQTNLTAPTFWIPGINRLTSDDCLKIYAGMVVALLFFSLLRSLVFRHMLTRSSFTLHSRMFRAVIRTPVIFFDRNPIGRILNRFSKDTGTMDELLAFVTFDFVQGLISFFGIILVVCLINPWVFVPTVPLLIAFVAVRYYYMKTARSIKRIEATTRSPIFSHVSATLSGLTTIRAFGAANYVIGDFHRFQNIHSSAFCIFLSSSRWFAIFIDWLCASFIGVVAFISVFTSTDDVSSGGAVGLSLFYAMSLMGFFQWIIRQSTEMESMMVCVERILEYSRLPPEAGLNVAEKQKIAWPGKLPDSWPERGEIIFDHVSLKYAEDGSKVLNDIDFVIKPAEKIGIVGRTGAGKSSLLNALFRLSEPTGTITIDGRDIKTVDLRDLRKRLSIIPQDPVLFIGTLRENLDPFGEFTDYQIWTALEQVELKGAVNEMPNRLSTSMQEGGANLSIGQRQLVCLARALLRRNKILVIDEATANVDLHTDALIQRTLRHQFRDCTVLTIAHRLNTIMDANRVMVLQDGRIIEFDPPATLLRDSESSFSKLVQETGRGNAQLLTTLAEEAYANNGQVKQEENHKDK